MKTCKKFAAVLLVLLGFMTGYTQGNNDTVRYSNAITLDFRAPGPEFVATPENELRVVMDNFPLMASPGDPALPAKVFDIAVPPNIDWASIRVDYQSEPRALKEDVRIPAASPYRARVGEEELIYWGEGKDIVEGRNVKVYQNDAFFPESPARVIDQGQMRKWKFIRLAVSPIQYNPVSGQLIIHDFITVSLTFDRIGREAYRQDPIMRDQLMDDEAKKRFYNFGPQVEGWYRTNLAPIRQGAFDYLIITTNDILSGSGNGLTSFVGHLTNKGHSVLVITENEYGAMAGAPPNGRAEKIRAWLQANYIQMGIKWVLLIGDPDPDDPIEPFDAVGNIPMKMCWPNIGYYTYRESPTDYFFADLTGNWDLDGDKVYGENISSSNSLSPHPLVAPTTYSVRWAGQIKVTENGNHTFATNSDAGVRFKMDLGSGMQTIIDNWTAHEHPVTDFASRTLTPGNYKFELEYYNLTDEGVVQLWWRPPSAYGLEIIPSTSYSGLTGSYYNNETLTSLVLARPDQNINFFWGTGDKGPGGPDFAAEVYVGRIPLYDTNYSELNKILQKIIDYQSVPVIPEWRRNVMFAAVNLWECGDNELGQSIKSDIADPLGYMMYRIYEDDYGYSPPPECPRINPSNVNPSAPCNMLGGLVNGPGYAFLGWSTHGSETDASGLISSSQTANLDNGKPFFTFQGSCLNGYPENHNNLGYALLKNGSIGTVSASRVSWSGCFNPPPDPNDGFNYSLSYYYTQRILNGLPSGQALYQTKDNVNPGWDWMNKMDYNLYGEPTTSIRDSLARESYAHMYSAKIVCGVQKEKNNLRLAPGIYATAINIHNPGFAEVNFFKKLALTFPPAEQREGAIHTIAVDKLGPDGALEVDCIDIQKRLFPEGFPASYIKGFVVIESPAPLDVTAVYTAAKRGYLFSPQRVVSMDVEQIRERPLGGEPPTIEDGCPDLIVKKIILIKDNCEDSSSPNCVASVTYTIANVGTAPAGPFNIRVEANPGKFGTEYIPGGLAPGSELTITTTTAPGGYCFNNNCTVVVTVDSGNTVSECNENNNQLSETAPG